MTKLSRVGFDATLSHPPMFVLVYLDPAGELQQDNFAEVPRSFGAYAVSPGGVIISLLPKGDGRWMGTELSRNLNARGYEYVCIDGRRRFVHRIVAETFLQHPNSEDTNGNPRNEVNHFDGDKRNNKAANLGFMSRPENIGFNSIWRKAHAERQFLRAVSGLNR